MFYRSVESRCAVVLSELHLPFTDEQALILLQQKGIILEHTNLVELARSCIKTSSYRRGALPCEAPMTVDCSSFIKWLYGQMGIWLPRRSIQQRDEPAQHLTVSELKAGDVVFTSGWINYFHTDPTDGVGHVGIATDEETIIHAANSRVGVIETPTAEFIKDGFRGARRYIPTDTSLHTFTYPATLNIDRSDDLRWVLLQSLPKISTP